MNNKHTHIIDMNYKLSVFPTQDWVYGLPLSVQSFSLAKRYI